MPFATEQFNQNSLIARLGELDADMIKIDIDHAGGSARALAVSLSSTSIHS
jgi:hypothetical protein